MSGDQHPAGDTDNQTDLYDDEEVPTLVLIIVGALAVLTAVLYLWLGGGHSHFH